MQFRAARRHGQRFCTDELPAAHVERRVADDDDLLWLQIFPQHTARAIQGGGGDVVALLVVVGEPAEMERLPQAEFAELDLCAELDVAGEQAEHGWLRQGLKVVDELSHAATFLAVELVQHVVEPEDVILEEPAEISRRFRQTVDAEKLTDKAHVRAPGELHLFRAVMQVELRGERPRERFRARAARMHQRAVNVEQNQSNHAPAYQAGADGASH